MNMKTLIGKRRRCLDSVAKWFGDWFAPVKVLLPPLHPVRLLIVVPAAGYILQLPIALLNSINRNPFHTYPAQSVMITDVKIAPHTVNRYVWEVEFTLSPAPRVIEYVVTYGCKPVGTATYQVYPLNDWELLQGYSIRERS